MKTITGKDAAQLLTELIPRLVPESRAFSLFLSPLSEREFDKEVEKHKTAVDDALIAVSLSKNKDAMRAVINDLPEDVFRMFMSRWASGIKELLAAQNQPVIFLPVVNNPLPALIRLALVKDKSRVCDIHSVP